MSTWVTRHGRRALAMLPLAALAGVVGPRRRRLPGPRALAPAVAPTPPRRSAPRRSAARERLAAHRGRRCCRPLVRDTVVADVGSPSDIPASRPGGLPARRAPCSATAGPDCRHPLGAGRRHRSGRVRPRTASPARASTPRASPSPAILGPRLDGSHADRAAARLRRRPARRRPALRPCRRAAAVHPVHLVGGRRRRRRRRPAQPAGHRRRGAGRRGLPLLGRRGPRRPTRVAAPRCTATTTATRTSTWCCG